MSDFGGKVIPENFDGSRMRRLFRPKSVEGHTTRRVLQLKTESVFVLLFLVLFLILSWLWFHQHALTFGFTLCQSCIVIHLYHKMWIGDQNRA